MRRIRLNVGTSLDWIGLNSDRQTAVVSVRARRQQRINSKRSSRLDAPEGAVAHRPFEVGFEDLNNLVVGQDRRPANRNIRLPKRAR